MSLFIYMVGYMGFRQPEIFSGYQYSGRKTEQKYSKSSLTDEQAKELLTRLLEFMTKEWACQTFQPCSTTPGAKPRPARPSWNSAWTSWISRAKGAEAIPQFLEQFPDCIILATCRRHQNHGKFNGSIEEQLAVLDLAVRNGAHAIDVEIETAEVAAGAPERSSAAARRSSSPITISKPRRPWTRWSAGS